VTLRCYTGCSHVLPDDHWRAIAGNRHRRHGSVTQFNVIATSGRAVEAAGDVTTIILDKTGTITIGNRLAQEFIPLGDKTEADVTRASFLSSVSDETPEGRSIVALAQKLIPDLTRPDVKNVIDFSASTKMSGVDLADGREVRKGAFDVMSDYVRYVPQGFREIIDGIAQRERRHSSYPWTESR